MMIERKGETAIVGSPTTRKEEESDRLRDAWIVLCISILICSTSALSMEPRLETVRVVVCQMLVEDGMISENLTRAEAFVRDARAAKAEVCVFPELMDVGFGDVVKGKSETRLAFPIPGDTSDKLGEIARKYDVWIVAALLEEVDGGAYDTNVIIDSRGTVVHKQRKAFCYPSFAGVTSFQGNYQDVRAIPSPWGQLAVVNCADTNADGKRKIIAAQQPSLVFVNFANPQANLLRNCSKLAAECGCPVVGVNMIFPSGGKHKGGKSRVVSTLGEILWEGGQTEIMKTWDLALQVPGNLPPIVAAGDIQTIQLPEDRVELGGFAVDDGLPNGTLIVRWSKVSGPGMVIFEDAGALATTAAFDSPGVYALQLTADDGAAQNSDYVSVNVLASDGRDPNLVGYWTFDQTTEDQSGKENHATINGKVVYSEDAAPTGFRNTHLLSLEEKAFVLVPHSPSLSTPSSVTVAMWVRLRSSPPMWHGLGAGWVAFLAKGKWWKENYAIGIGDYFYLFGRGFGEMLCPALDNIVRDSKQWHHVVTVFDASKQEGKLYIDGVLDHRTFNAPTVEPNSEPLYMGCFSHESFTLDGLLDDVRVYTRALSDQEIAALVPGAKINQPPFVNAGRDFSVSFSDKARLSGAYRDDEAFASSRTAAWVSWDRISGPGDVYFENRFAPVTTASFTKPGEYVLELRASDGAHLVSDMVKVNVK